jgi:CRISPR-associated protein (TIGR02584 family)
MCSFQTGMLNGMDGGTRFSQACRPGRRLPAGFDHAKFPARINDASRIFLHDARMNAKRRILLAVTGLTPQVVTETLYALALTQDPPWLPDEVHLITTATGAENARLNLLAQPDGWFYRFCRDYGLSDIAFPPDHIHVLVNKGGQPLEDIRSPEENILAADLITEKVRKLTETPDTELHVSIAGGRKTMGYYLGYALSLYGRLQDRLSHVLVSDPFESNRQFYYPTPYDHAIFVRRGGMEVAYNARNAKVDLAEIPFVSLRHGLPQALLTGHASFHSTVEAARATLGPTQIVIDVKKRLLQASGKTFRLPPSQFALVCVLAYRALTGAPPLRAPLKDVKDSEWARDYLADLRAVCSAMHLPDRVEAALADGVDEGYFSQHLSRLRAKLRKELGPAASPYLIDDGNVRPRRYSLGLAPEAIRFVEIDKGSFGSD